MRLLWSGSSGHRDPEVVTSSGAGSGDSRAPTLLCTLTVMFNIADNTTAGRRVATLFAGLVMAGAIALPSAASASTMTDGGATAGGSAAITGGEGSQVIIDDTIGDGKLRTTEKVGGGVWIYGIGGGNSYSYYDHSSKTHKSTACAGFGTSCKYSGWVSKGTRSVAQVLRTAGGNTAFWDTK